MPSVEDLIMMLREEGHLDGRREFVTGELYPDWIPQGADPREPGTTGLIQPLPSDASIRYDTGDEERPPPDQIIDEGTRDRIDRDVEDRGVEALAWYIPFHASKQAWGIYLRETGLGYVSDFLLETGRPIDEVLKTAQRFLKRHEVMHFHTEIVTSHQELAANGSIYLDRKDSHTGGPVPSLELLEESLCNANAMRTETDEIASRLAELTKQQPAGYRDWEEVQWRTRFQKGFRNYFGRTSDALDLGPVPWYPYLSWSRQRSQTVPVFLVRDAVEPLDIALEFSYGGITISVHYANEHPPPHFHVKHRSWNKERRYTYPDFDPAKPTEVKLTGSEKEAIEAAIERYDGFEEDFQRHKSIVEDGYDPEYGISV